jgi:hypothetical protein
MSSNDGAPGFLSMGAAFGEANNAYFAGEAPNHQRKGSQSFVVIPAADF